MKFYVEIILFCYMGARWGVLLKNDGHNSHKSREVQKSWAQYMLAANLPDKKQVSHQGLGGNQRRGNVDGGRGFNHLFLTIYQTTGDKIMGERPPL